MLLKKIKEKSKLIASILISTMLFILPNNFSMAETVIDDKEQTISNNADDIGSDSDSDNDNGSDSNNGNETLFDNNLSHTINNDFKIEASLIENTLTLNKIGLNDDSIVSKEIVIKENGYQIDTILPVGNYGFSIILKSNLISNSENNSDENNILFNYNLLLLNNDLEAINTQIYTNEISDNYLFKLLKNTYQITNIDIDSYLNKLEEDNIYDLAIYLVSIAEKSLNPNDIDDAKLVVDKISDISSKDLLLNKLNIIASESIDKELNDPNFGNDLISDSTLDIEAINTQSYIDLSVDTNNIIFDYLNLSEDTVINRAITIEVSSSLPYDINISLEGDISSSTNATPLNNNVFSIKESNSNDFLTFDNTGVINILNSQTAGDFISHNFDLKLNTKTNIIKDVYKAVFKIEAITK